MSSVVISGDTSGAITLAAPAVSGTNTATLPAATGTVMVSGNMPAFSAYPATAQTISTNVTTKVNFGTESFDTNNNFASSRFTPTVAGYYQINAQLSFSGTGAYNYYFTNYLYKNGSSSLGTIVAILQLGSGGGFSIPQSNLIYMNGSTDYLEVYTYMYDYTTSGTVTITTANTSFNGTLVRAA
jgi:hypothetical protein